MSLSMPFDAILFDMDGTLVDTEPLWQKAEQDLMSGFGLSWGAQDQARCLGASTARVSRYMADLVADTGQQRPEPAALAERFLDVMLGLLRADPPPPQPGVAHLLREVKDHAIPTALVTSSSRPLMSAVLTGLGRDWFDVTVCADDVPRHKPDPLPYVRAAELLGADPRRCLAIEDSPTGAAAATAAGCYVLAVEHMAPIGAAPRRTVLSTLAGVDVRWLASRYEPPQGGG
jgi:HAD superfamily hydrolase (TIGR01509 family)